MSCICQFLKRSKCVFLFSHNATIPNFLFAGELTFVDRVALVAVPVRVGIAQRGYKCVRGVDGTVSLSNCTSHLSHTHVLIARASLFHDKVGVTNIPCRWGRKCGKFSSS